MSKPKCYIAGPMRGYENCNFDSFDEAKAKVKALGYTPISPADMDRLFEGWVEYPPEDLVVTQDMLENMILRDLEVIGRQCSAVYMLCGWEHSKGAQVEHRLAILLDLTIIYQI